MTGKKEVESSPKKAIRNMGERKMIRQRHVVVMCVRQRRRRRKRRVGEPLLASPPSTKRRRRRRITTSRTKKKKKKSAAALHALQREERRGRPCGRYALRSCSPLGLPPCSFKNRWGILLHAPPPPRPLFRLLPVVTTLPVVCR